MSEPTTTELTDPLDDDLERELAARAPKQRINKITFVLAGLLLVIGGFIAGSLVQKNSGGTTGSALPTGTNGRGGYFPAGGFGGGGTAQGGTGTRAGAATTGTVKLVDGTTIYITTSSGETVTVKTSDSTKVSVSQSSTLKSIRTGATVTVQGQTGADGTVTATTVTAQK
ncbi:hypothetical protein GCM10009682_16460 [Luedemannella flava]|uniref:DUF5666 domain-containing protein n=1 Tax=Luedemannella flava TaxID=349316 RepID=A0ABN2LP69_9ACTN